MIDELSGLREKQIQEAKALAKLMIDTRLNFNNSFLSLDNTVEKYVTILHNIQSQLTNAKNQPKLKQVVSLQTEFNTTKEKYLAMMKSTIADAVKNFNQNFSYIQKYHAEAEDAAKLFAGDRKITAKSSNKKKKAVISLTKKQVWDNAVTMSADMIRQSGVENAVFLKIELEVFVASYHDRVEAVQYLTEASSKACQELLDAYRDETMFLDKIDKIVHDAEVKIKFQVCQGVED